METFTLRFRNVVGNSHLRVNKVFYFTVIFIFSDNKYYMFFSLSPVFFKCQVNVTNYVNIFFISW